ncbi:MAG: amidase [Actinobacteria bacterium]|nr:amidase [Actinomycetota bacterium]
MHHDPHLPTADLAYTAAADLLQQLADGTTTSEALVEGFLSRIAAIDAPGTHIELRSVLAVAADALDQARQRDQQRSAGQIVGPLHGVPVLIKDNVEALGLPGTAGSTSLLDRPVAQDAELVTHLRAAGAIIIGATNLSEWANIRSSQSSSGWSAVGGLTVNPWAFDRTAGGSSSGSGAAVAAGLAPFAVGTETDGSIICPASVNGVVGIKPTVGSVSRSGVVPISGSQDSPGPLARNVADAALLLQVLQGAGPDGFGEALIAAANVNDTPMTFGVLRGYRTGQPATDALFDAVVDTLAQAGFDIHDSNAPTPTKEAGDDELTVLLHELVDDLSAYLKTRGPNGPQSLAEVIAYEDAHADVELRWFGHDLFEMAVAGGGRDTDIYRDARARNVTWAVDVCLAPALKQHSVLIAPAYAPAWKTDFTNGGHALASPVTHPAAVAGYPIGCIPMGFVNGLPVGLAIIADANDEVTLVQAMARIEQVLAATGIKDLRPSFTPPSRG